MKLDINFNINVQSPRFKSPYKKKVNEWKYILNHINKYTFKQTLIGDIIGYNNENKLKIYNFQFLDNSKEFTVPFFYARNHIETDIKQVAIDYIEEQIKEETIRRI